MVTDLFSGTLLLSAESTLGRLTGMPLITVMDMVATMKKTSRKNMVSIIGIISMRAFFFAPNLLIFIGSCSWAGCLRVFGCRERHLEARGVPLYLGGRLLRL